MSDSSYQHAPVYFKLTNTNYWSVDIISGRVADDDAAVNVYDPLELGTGQCLEYVGQWPAGFYKLTQKVKTMAAATKQTTKLGNNMHATDSELIKAHAMGNMELHREAVSIETLFFDVCSPTPNNSHYDSGEDQQVQVKCGMWNR